jgi:hypothetical protein
MSSAIHTAIIREAQLAAQQIGQGVTALGKANHAETGLYSQAFFGLSIGIERMGKLIFIADFAICNSGKFPDDKALRGFGHDISSLLPKCDAIGKTVDPERGYPDRPNDPINQGIEEVLTLFATKLRYYNLSHLAGSAVSQRDPIALWWEKVAIPICDRHYTQRQQEKDLAEAEIFEKLLGNNAFVMHTSEEGTPIRDMTTFVGRGKATRVVQSYGRMYTLQIVRWLESILHSLSHKGAYECRIEGLLGMYEPFARFHNEDRDLKRWKSW